MARPRRKEALFSKATQYDDWGEGSFIRHMRAQRLSQNTINDYTNTFRHFTRIMPDKNLRDYTVENITHFMAEMATEIQELPGIARRKPKRRSSKTLLNFKVALSQTPK